MTASQMGFQPHRDERHLIFELREANLIGCGDSQSLSYLTRSLDQFEADVGTCRYSCLGLGRDDGWPLGSSWSRYCVSVVSKLGVEALPKLYFSREQLKVRLGPSWQPVIGDYPTPSSALISIAQGLASGFWGKGSHGYC